MIKVFCDMCGKEIERDEKPVLMRVTCPTLTGEGALEQHMHEGCAVCFLGAENVAAYERMQQEARKTTAKAMQEMWEAAEKAAQKLQEAAEKAAPKKRNKAHNCLCAVNRPTCICLRCAHDGEYETCCYRAERKGCVVKNCPDFEPEEKEGADNGNS